MVVINATNSSPDAGDYDKPAVSADPPGHVEIDDYLHSSIESGVSVYRYLDKMSGAEFPFEDVFHEVPEITPGDVVEIQKANGKKDYFSVDSVVEGETVIVYLVRARNSLWKSILLLVLLGVSWVVIDFFLKLVF
jgi:hypothetical protein